MKLASTLALGLAALFLEATARAGVLVVDAGGSGQFTDIPRAVAVAQEGDTILVKAGHYTGFQVGDLSLVIAADDGALVTIAGTVEIQNTSAARTVVLSGLTITGDSSGANPTPALTVQGNSGNIQAEGCSFTGGNWSGPLYATGEAAPGVELYANLGGTAFTHCTLQGGHSNYVYYSNGIAGGPGLDVVDSRIASYDCSLSGGDGSSGEDYVGGNGGAGAHLNHAGCFLHGSGSSFQGGNGGVGCDTFIGIGISGNGGDGILLDSASAWIVDSSIQPGAGGPGGQCPPGGGTAGLPGHPFGGSGTHYDLGVSRLEMDCPRLVREGHDILLTLRGAPGLQVYLLVSHTPTFNAIPSWRGVRVARRNGSPEMIRVLGSIPQSGVLMEGIHIDDLPPGVDADTWFLQAYRVATDGRVLGSFSALTVLDSAY